MSRVPIYKKIIKVNSVSVDSNRKEQVKITRRPNNEDVAFKLWRAFASPTAANLCCYLYRTAASRVSGQRKPQRLSWSTVQFPSSSPVPSVQFGFPDPWLPPAELWPKPQWAAILVLTSHSWLLSRPVPDWLMVVGTTPGKVSVSPLGSAPGRLAILSSSVAWVRVVLLMNGDPWGEERLYTRVKIKQHDELKKNIFWTSKRVLKFEISTTVA